MTTVRRYFAAYGRDHVNRYQIGLGYGLSSAYAVDLGYERVEYDLRNNDGSLGTTRTGNMPASRLRLHDPRRRALTSTRTPRSSCCTRSFTTTTRAPASATQRCTGDNNYSGDIAVGQFSLKF